MTDKEPAEKSVGYKHPPKATQFKPGRSGNPKGRPRGAKNFATALEDELAARVLITENGKRRTISKRQAIAKQIVNKAASGDLKAIPVVLNETRLREEGLSVSFPSQIFSTLADQQVMASIVARIRAAVVTDESAASEGSTAPGQQPPTGSPTEERP